MPIKYTIYKITDNNNPEQFYIGSTKCNNSNNTYNCYAEIFVINYFDDIVGPPLYESAAYQYSPENNDTAVSVGSNMTITTNDTFTAGQGATISNVNSVVALRQGDINGPDVPFTASINVLASSASSISASFSAGQR